MKSKIFLFIIPIITYANPASMNVCEGEACLFENGKLLEVETSHNSKIEWQSFSIAHDEITRFIQPNSDSTVLNRIIGPNPSEIFGKLEANGKVLLVNPEGVLFGKSSSINVTSLIASTLDILQKEDHLEFASNESTGSIVNLGHIESTNGDVFLVAPNVENHGQIVATDGTTALVTCSEMVLAKSGKERIFVKTNLNELDENVFASAFKHSEADALEFDGESLIVTGTLSSKNSDQTGGEVYLIGDHIFLEETSKIDASGDLGGGRVHIGGEYQGKEKNYKNSKLIKMHEDAFIEVDAKQTGNGGTVILFADEINDFRGQISARGGSINGNGGFAEVSCKDHLWFKGHADLRAEHGSFGTILLDPTDITINGVATGGTWSAPPNIVYTPGPNPDTILAADLIFQLSMGNVSISTSSTASAAGNVRITSGITWPDATGLSIVADGTVDVEASIMPTSGLFTGTAIDIRAGSTLTIGFPTQAAPISLASSGGGIYLSGSDILLGNNTIAGANVNITTITATTGSIDIHATGLLRFLGGPMLDNHVAVEARDTVTISASTLEMTAGAGTDAFVYANTLTGGTGGQTITVSGDITLRGGPSPGTGSYAELFQIILAQDQTVSANSITLLAGTGVGGYATLKSGGGQTINTGDIFLRSTVPGSPNVNEASIEYDRFQVVNANNITLEGNTVFGYFSLPTGGPQSLNISGNVTARGLSGAAAGLGPFFFVFPAAAQTGTIGGDVLFVSTETVAPPSTSDVNVHHGLNSNLTVNGNYTMLANGGGVNVVAENNLNLTIHGNMLMDTTASLAGSQFTATQGFVLNVDGNVDIGSLSSMGTQGFAHFSAFTMNIGGNFTFQGGVLANSQSFINHTPIPTAFDPALINVGGNMSLTGGSGTDSHAVIFTFGPTSYRVGGNLTLAGGKGASQGYLGTIAITGIADPSVAPDLLSIHTHDIQVGGNILIQSGSTPGSLGYIISGNSFQTVSAGGNISVIGGPDTAMSPAVLGGGWLDTMPPFSTVADNMFNQIQAAGNVTFQNGNAGSVAYFDVVASGVVPPQFVGIGFPGGITNNPTTRIFANGDVSLSSGISTMEIANTFGTHPIEIEADHPFNDGDLWSGNGQSVLSGTPVFGTSTALQSTGRGGIRVETGVTATNIVISSVAGDITIKSGERFTTSVFANLRVGPLADEMTIGSSTGNINIDPFHNITITNPITTGGDVFVMAQNDIDFTSTGSIAGNNVNIICDNQAPFAPLIGPGRFIMETGSSITSGATLRIFTARQQQNFIQGTLNGNTFVPGTLYINTLQERWATYFNSLFNGVPFTVFYKDSASQAFYQASIIATELLRDLHPYGITAAGGWEEKFELSWFDPSIYPSKEPYYIKRPRLLNNPKTYTAKYF